MRPITNNKRGLDMDVIEVLIGLIALIMGYGLCMINCEYKAKQKD